MKLTTVNDYVLLEPFSFEEEKESSLKGFEDFINKDKEESNLYRIVGNLPAHSWLYAGTVVLVDMVQLHTIKDKTYYTCRTNHIVGVLEHD